MGKPLAAALIYICGCFIAIPIEYWFTFVLDWGLSGLWSGFGIGLICNFIVYLIIIYGVIDWDKEGKLVADRAKLEIALRAKITAMNGSQEGKEHNDQEQASLITNEKNQDTDIK